MRKPLHLYGEDGGGGGDDDDIINLLHAESGEGGERGALRRKRERERGRDLEMLPCLVLPRHTHKLWTL